MKFNLKHLSFMVMLLVSNYLFGQSISSRPALQTLFTTGSTLTQAKMYSFLNSYVHKNDSAPTYSALVRQDTTHPISYVRFPFSTILGRLSSGNVVAIPFTTLKTAVGLNTILKGAGVPSNSIGVAGDIYYDTVGHYLYNPKTTVWVNRTQLVGTNGTNGSPGANGTNGNTVLNGNTAPSNGTGNNGDFFLNTATNYIYGPKASGTWPGGVSIIGATGSQGIAGNNGTNGSNGAAGTNGTNGNTVLYGTANPTSQGNNGDFYINTTSNYIFGPKAGGAWPSGTSLVGPTGATGAGVVSGMYILGLIGSTYTGYTAHPEIGGAPTGGYQWFVKN